MRQTTLSARQFSDSSWQILQQCYLISNYLQGPVQLIELPYPLAFVYTQKIEDTF